MDGVAAASASAGASAKLTGRTPCPLYQMTTWLSGVSSPLLCLSHSVSANASMARFVASSLSRRVTS